MSRMDKKRRQKEAAAVTDIAGKVKKKVVSSFTIR